MINTYHGWKVKGPMPVDNAALPWRCWAAKDGKWEKFESDSPCDVLRLTHEWIDRQPPGYSH